MEAEVEQKVKRVKRNICPTCLGILENPTMEEFVSNISLENIEYYKSKDFITIVSLPKCILLRNYSIYLHLQKLYPEIIKKPFVPTGKSCL